MRTIGRSLIISLPDQGIENIIAKVDAGAYRSAIHCHDVKLEQDAAGGEILSVKFLDPAHAAYNHKELRFKDFSTTRVVSSFGQKQERYMVKLKVEINGEVFDENFTLADRSAMRNAVLLGRTLLRGNFLVDVSKYRINITS